MTIDIAFEKKSFYHKHHKNKAKNRDKPCNVSLKYKAKKTKW